MELVVALCWHFFVEKEAAEIFLLACFCSDWALLVVGIYSCFFHLNANILIFIRDASCLYDLCFYTTIRFDNLLKVLTVCIFVDF